jgi:Protein of unknown function (DUF3108)
MIRFALILALLSIHALAHGAVREIKSTYFLYHGKLKLGEVHETFVVRDNQYSIESVAKPILGWLLPTLTQTSSGVVTATGLQPHHFQQRLSNRPEKTVSAEFDWQAGTLLLSFGGNSVTHELKPLTFDSLTLKYQFMFTPPAGAGTVLLTNGKKVEQYQYRVLTDEKVTTPFGDLDALHVSKVASPGEALFDLWLGKAQHYVPVKVLAEDDGQRLEQLLSTMQIEEGG